MRKSVRLHLLLLLATITQHAHCATLNPSWWPLRPLAHGPVAGDSQADGCATVRYQRRVSLVLLRGGQSAPVSAPGGSSEQLYAAVAQGDVDLLRELLAGGASPDWTDGRGGGPLHVAAVTGQEQMARELIAAGARVDGRDVLGFTPLVWALLVGQAPVAGVLQQAKPAQAAELFDGLTPLMLAAATGDAPLVAALLPDETTGSAAGPSGAHGLTPMDVAQTLGHTGVSRLLLERGLTATSLGEASPSFPGAAGENSFEIRETSVEELERDPSIWDAAIADSVPLLVRGFAREWSERVCGWGTDELRARWGEKEVLPRVYIYLSIYIY